MTGQILGTIYMNCNLKKKGHLWKTGTPNFDTTKKHPHMQTPWTSQHSWLPLEESRSSESDAEFNVFRHLIASCHVLLQEGILNMMVLV